MDELGGAQIHVRDLCLWLKSQGHEPMVLSGWTGKVSDFLQYQGIRTVEIPDLERPIHPWKDLKALWQIIKALRRNKPDILSCHSSKAGLLGRIAAKLCGVPVIFTAHGWAFTEGVPKRERQIYRLIEKVAAWFSDHIITVSKYDRDLALKYGISDPKHMTAVHNGMPDRPAPQRQMGSWPTRMLMVARVGPQKDHARLLRALWGCMELEWTLDFAGGGDDLELRQLAEQLGLADRVTFLGERDDVPELMEKKTDLYVLVSNWEGLPRSILEAMRAGLPVIASDVGGVREEVIDGENGLVVTAGQDQELLRALKQLLPDRERQLAMGKKGREIFEKNFTFLAMANRTMDIYKAVLLSRGRLAPVVPPVDKTDPPARVN